MPCPRSVPLSAGAGRHAGRGRAAQRPHLRLSDRRVRAHRRQSARAARVPQGPARGLRCRARGVLCGGARLRAGRGRLRQRGCHGHLCRHAEVRAGAWVWVGGKSCRAGELPRHGKPAVVCPGCRASAALLSSKQTRVPRAPPPFGACRNGVEPDTQLYGQLMTAAGAAGDLDLALGLHEEMQREGLQPCTVRLGALPAAVRGSARCRPKPLCSPGHSCCLVQHSFALSLLAWQAVVMSCCSSYCGPNVLTPCCACRAPSRR